MASATDAAVSSVTAKGKNPESFAARVQAVSRLELELSKEQARFSLSGQRPIQRGPGVVPSPLFNAADQDARDKAHKHMRSISSTMR
jgi:hypothetical protein